MRNLREVLRCLRGANLSLRLDKCNYFSEKIDYSCFEVDANGISPGKLKLNSIVHFPVPVDVKSVRSFVGLTSFFRRFVKNFVIVVRPQTDLLERIKLLNRLKLNKICLKRYSLYCVANQFCVCIIQMGLGGVLYQKQKDKNLHPIYYSSKKKSQGITHTSSKH